METIARAEESDEGEKFLGTAAHQPKYYKEFVVQKRAGNEESTTGWKKVLL